MNRFPENIKIEMVNRLTDAHLELARQIVKRTYQPMDAFVHERLCQFALLRARKRLPTQILEFKYDNKDEDYLTMMALRDQGYSVNQLAISHAHFVGINGAKDLEKPLTYAKAMNLLGKVYLKDDRYCNPLVLAEYQELILNVGSCLAATHDFGVRVVREKRILEVTMKAHDRSSLLYFYSRDLNAIEEEQHRIAQALRGTSVELDPGIRH
jgi:hypothetical protein